MKEDNKKEDDWKEDNQKAAGCYIRKEDFFKMQDKDISLKCPKGRIKYIFEDELNRLIENHMGETPTKQLVIPKEL